MGGAGRQGGEGGDHRCRAEPAPHEVGRGGGVGSRRSTGSPKSVSLPWGRRGAQEQQRRRASSCHPGNQGTAWWVREAGSPHPPSPLPRWCPEAQATRHAQQGQPPTAGAAAAQVKENENLSVAPSAGKQRPPTHCFTCRETTQQARSTTKGT